MKYLRNALIKSLPLLLLVLPQAHGQVYNPWVLLKGEPDTRDLKKVVHALYEQSGAETDRDKAEAIWQYLLTDGRFVEPGIFYHLAGWAYEEPAGEVLDPLKLLNSYGQGLCYQIAPLLEALYDAGDFEDTRVWFLTGHTVTEVYFDGKYNMLDSDMLGYTTLGEGDPRKSRIASVKELENDKQIILGKMTAPDRADSSKVVYPWYPADVRAKAMGGYAGLFTSKKDNYLFPYTRYSSGHTMDFLLRPGERLVRFYKPENEGLFYLPYMKDDGEWVEFARQFARWEPKTELGPRSQKDPRLWGTGRIEYKPPLWRREAYHPACGPGFNDNLSLPQSPDEPLVREDLSLNGAAVFEMPSPYVLIDAQVSCYAELASASHRLTVETSDDGGVSWQGASTVSGPFSGPWKTGAAVLAAGEHGCLTAVSGKYGYLARLVLSGPPEASGGPRVREVKLTSLIQLNPRTLPELAIGHNELIYIPGPSRLRKYTIPVSLERLDEFALKTGGLVTVLEDDNLLVKPAGRTPGEILFALAAPDSAEITAFHAGGRFLTLEGLAPEKLTAETRKTVHSSPNPRKAQGSVAWALSPEGPFTTLWEYDPAPEWPDRKPEKRCLRWPEVDRRVSGTPSGTRLIYLRYRVKDMALDKLRLTIFTRAPESSSPLEATHQWMVNGLVRRHTMMIEDPAREMKYNIYTGRRGEVENISLTFSCPVER